MGKISEYKPQLNQAFGKREGKGRPKPAQTAHKLRAVLLPVLNLDRANRTRKVG